MNPFKEKDIKFITEKFYRKYYDDHNKRKLILGINPGRLGAGATGIPFTDTKRLSKGCNIELEAFDSHEPSSVFIYKVIEAYGGAEKFYSDFYINSVCPLGFLNQNTKGNWVNCNYYDYKVLFEKTRSFIVDSLNKQIQFGIDIDSVVILGKKNAKFFKLINDQEKLFKSIMVLDHPRYVVQYKSKNTDDYIKQYLNSLLND